MRFVGNFIAAENKKGWIKFTCQEIAKLKQSVFSSFCFNLAISGGNTPKLIFENLISNIHLSQSEWEKSIFFWVNERVVDIESNDSNYGNAMKYLSRLLSKFFQMYNESIGIEVSLNLYKKKLKVLPIENHIPKFDLTLLGMGDDGHTASLFPNTKGLLEQKEYFILNEVPQLNTKRITLSFPVIKNAEEILILFNGKEKKAIINKIILGEVDYPIDQLLDSKAPKTWLYF